MFVSDNGGHPLANAARNDPLRGQKGEVYEGGIRVPFVVAWPERLPAGGTYAQPVTTLDILPTALAAAGVGPPADLRLDGVDLIPFLAGTKAGPPHEALFWKYGDHHAVRSGPWKLTVPANGEPGLYGLSADIAESKDVSAAEPGKLAELEKLYSDWAAELPPPAWGPGILEGSTRRGFKPKPAAANAPMGR